MRGDESERPRSQPRATPLSEAEAVTATLSTGDRPLDKLLGGGMLPGTVTLVYGPPGSGKSTLAYRWASGLGRTLLVCPEMAAPVARATAERGGAKLSRMWLAPESGWRAEAERLEATALVVDSVSKLRRPVGVVAALTDWAQTSGGCVLAIAHESKRGRALGPVALSHDPDAVIRVTPGGSGHATVRLSKCRWAPAGQCYVRLARRR